MGLETFPGPPEGTPLLRLVITVAYDGAGYAGWQVQHSGVGVQEKVEEALGRLFGVRPRIHSASRTDAGVHALGMVAHFDIPKDRWRMSLRKLTLAINAHLPEDIRVVSARFAPRGFHARFSASGKEYRYQVWNHTAMSPLLRHTAWHVPRPLDVKVMQTAAKTLLGQHDFRSFAANRNYEVENTVRTIRRCQIRRQGPLLTFIVEGDGFLYKMVRGIVGTLVQIGSGRFGVDGITRMLEQRDRSAAGMTAPAHGLVLVKVFYGRKDPSTDPRRSPGHDPEADTLEEGE